MVPDYLRISGSHPPDSALGSWHRYRLSSGSKFMPSSHICPLCVCGGEEGLPGANEGRKTFMSSGSSKTFPSGGG